MAKVAKVVVKSGIESGWTTTVEIGSLTNREFVPKSLGESASVEAVASDWSQTRFEETNCRIFRNF
jgi:hypothetical protein